jgi:hypothetical protein
MSGGISIRCGGNNEMAQGSPLAVIQELLAKTQILEPISSSAHMHTVVHNALDNILLEEFKQINANTVPLPY